MSSTIEVLITLPFPAELIQKIEQVSARLHVVSLRAGKPEEVPASAWEQVEVLYTDSVVPAPDQAPKLRWIQFHYAGLETVIDRPILARPGIVATSLSGAAASQVAEYVLLMILALGHRLPDLIDHQDKASWPADRWKRFSPQELRGSRIGLVGYGSIGREVARLVHAFGGEILATKRDAKQPGDGGYIPEGMGDPPGDLVYRLYPPQALRSMLKECDFVVVAVPLTKATSGLIGAAELEAMKSTACLVDVSRGGIVDQTALIAALRDHEIAGAALDVFAEEPLPADSPLWKFPNVIVTPHIAGISPQYDLRAFDLFAENLKRYLESRPLLNRFDLGRGY
jgi:phosphoglycerate dehydrogenase-like enzyme